LSLNGLLGMETCRGQRQRWRSHPKTEEFLVKSQFPAQHPTFKQYLASASIGLALAFSIALPTNVYSAPFAPATTSQAVAQNVDYISTDAGYALDLGFTVLVPSWIPGPFGGPPSIDSGGGYYSLYWMNAGGDPTFLQVSGTVGGSLPAGSPYDLNNELFINASVQGYSAIHDVTPAYDAVWWIAGGVLYKVESRNSSTDSLSLANSLIPFSPPSAPEPEPEPTAVPQPVEPTPVPAEDPVDVSEPVSEPVVEDDVPAEDPVSEESASVEEPAPPDNTSDEQAEEPTDQPADTAEVEDPEATETPTVSDGTGDPSPSSDGTGGPGSYVVGGDGTGGITDVVVPRRPSSGTETP
jgi:hypothetical protein